jgi:transcriptional regulator with XRE-family HTH domain
MEKILAAETGKKKYSRQVMDPRNSVDARVGRQLQERRRSLRLSRRKLADALGSDLREIENFEYGTHRIGAKRLIDLSRVLGVPLSFFFEDSGIV